jgi:iron complex outermembrane recepter protein
MLLSIERWSRLLACLWLATLLSASDQDTAEKNPFKGLSLADLGNISVTTQSKQPEKVWKTAAAIFVLTQEDIRRSGVTNVPDALRLVPGVEVARVSGDRNWAVSSRGFSDQFSKQVQVLIDGRSVYTPLFGGAFWTINHVMLEDIDRIEVIRGPGGTIWGANAVNGVINIITKEAKETQGVLLALGGGSVDQFTGDFRYGGGNGKDYAYRINGTGFLRGPQFHPDNINYDDSNLGQFGMRNDWERGRDRFTLQGDVYRAELGDAQRISTFVPPGAFLSYQPTRAAGGNLVGRWNRQLNDRSHLYVQAFWEHTWRSGPNFAEDRDTFDADFLHKVGAGARHDVTYGAGMHISPGRSRQVVPTIAFQPRDRTNRVFSAFLQDEFAVIPGKLALTVGTKLENNQYTGFEYQPSGRLLFTPNKSNSFWLAVTRAVRTPSRVDSEIVVDVFAGAAPLIYAQLLGNPNIRAERVISYEGGYRTLVHPTFYLDVAGFVSQHNDVVSQSNFTISTRTTTPAPPHLLFQLQFVNAIHGRTSGFEVAPNWKPSSRWEVKGSYSLLQMDLRLKPFVTRRATLDFIQGSSPTHQVVVYSQFNLPKRFEFDQVYRYVSELRGQNVPAYHTGDLRLGWKAHRQFELSLVGQNLLQPRHAEFGIDPAPTVSIKRGVYGKIVWRSR